MTTLFSGTIYSMAFLALFIVIEYLTRKNNFNKELTRKLDHLLSGLFAIFMGLSLEAPVFLAFVFIFFIIIFLSYKINFFSSIHNVKRKTYGELLLPLGIFTAFIFANGPTPIYIASVLIMAISDPLSGIIGSMFQRNYPCGSLFFFISALLILLIIFQNEKIFSLALIALVITLAERVSPLGTDNLTVPLVSTLLLGMLL